MFSDLGGESSARKGLTVRKAQTQSHGQYRCGTGVFSPRLPPFSRTEGHPTALLDQKPEATEKQLPNDAGLGSHPTEEREGQRGQGVG